MENCCLLPGCCVLLINLRVVLGGKWQLRFLLVSVLLLTKYPISEMIGKHGACLGLTPAGPAPDNPRDRKEVCTVAWN